MNTKDKLQIVELFGNELKHRGIEDTSTFEEKMELIDAIIQFGVKLVEFRKKT